MDIERHCNIQDLLCEEFACWWSACRAKKKQKSKMPQELPTSDKPPMAPHLNLNPAQPGTAATSVANTVVIRKEVVLSSVCEAVRSQASSIANTSNHAKAIDLVVVSNTEQGTPTSVAHIGTTTTTTQASCKYKLSEIVSREKDVLFQTDKDPNVELEPARDNVFSVRRRRRQFFTVLEEDENGQDARYNPVEIVLDDTNKNEETEVEPIFNLGESLKKLYFPHEHTKKRPKRKKERDLKNSHSSAHNHGYVSDPENKLDLCKIISEKPEFKQYKSHPELSQVEENMPISDDIFEIRRSKSLPTTPRVSPKLLRRNSMKSEKNQNEVQKVGPGFSFLESVAGQLHLKKQQHGKKLEKGVMRVPEGQVVSSRTPEVPALAQPTAETSMMNWEPAMNMHTHDFSDSAELDLESPKSTFTKSFFNWSATKKVSVTNKESNMFSPTSF